MSLNLYLVDYLKSKNRLFIKSFTAAFILLLLLIGLQTAEAQITSAQSGNWSDTNTWVGGVVPTTENVVIAHTVTVDVDASCGDISINDGSELIIGGFIFTVSGTTTVGGGTSGILTINNATGIKTFSGAVTINGGGAITETDAAQLSFGSDVSINGTLTEFGAAIVEIAGTLINNGTYNSSSGVHTFSGASKTIAGSSTSSIASVDISGTYTNGGSLTVATALSGAGSLTQGAGSTLNIGGTSAITSLDASTNAGNTVNYIGGVQTVHTGNYQNLNFSGSGTKTLQAGTTTIGGNLALSGTASTTTVIDLIIGGNLSIGDGTTFTAAGFNLTVTGATTVGVGTSGALTISSATGAKTFTGLVTVSAGATWTNTAANSPVTFRGGITNNGTFNSGTGVHTFDTNAQALTGTFSIPSVTVTGVTLTNNNTLTVATALSGTGGLTLATNATLNIGTASAITTLDASTNAGNTVNYTGAAQAVHTGNYQNLNFSGSAAKTLAVGTTSIGNLTLSGTATTATVADLAITGNLTIGNGTAFTAAGFDLTVTGTTTVGGGTSGALTISSATGAKTFTGLVTVSAGATWNNSGNSPVTFRGGITNSSTFTAGSGVHTFDTNAQALTGTFTIPSITVTGVTLTNNNTLTVATALSGSGGLTQGSGSTLSLGGTYAITSFDAATNTNLVTYTGASPAIRATNYSSLTIAGSGTATVGGATVVNATMTVSSATTNNSTLTATTALSGGSTLTNGGTGILNIGGTSGINALTATAVGNIVNYTGAAQTVKATTYRTLGLSGSGAKDMTGVTTIQTDFNMSGTASATATAALTIGVGVATGNVTLGSGTTFIAGAFTHNVTGNWVNNGSIFTNTGSTINFNLAGAQSVGGSSSTTFNNLTLATSGNKTFGIQTIVGGTLTISGTAKADLGSITTHTANALTLGAAAQTSGTWGSTSSAATNKNDTYFLAPNTGIVTVATSPCTAGTWIGTTSTDWNDPSNWCGGVPTSSTNVVINSGGFQPVIGAAGGLANNITINGGATLTITGSNSLTVSGNWTNSGTFTANTSTVIFNGAGKTITGATTFYNVTLNGSATVTTLAAVTMNGNLTIGDGTTFTVGAFALTVTGTTTVGGGTSGALTISSATGAKTFTGLVTVSAGATWTNTAANSPVTFRGGITNNGTFNSGTGVHTFDTNAQALTGTLSIPSVTVTGVTLTNNNILTVATALIGASGGLTQATNATLNIGATNANLTIGTLTATAAGNTVDYNLAGAQTVKVTTYHNLILSGSGIKTFAVTTVNNNLTLTGAATATTGAALAIGGNLTIGNGTAFTAAGFDLTVTGTTTVGGGTSGALTISSATGAKTFTGLVTVSAGATWNNSGNSPVTFRGGITNSSTFTAGSGVHTFDTNAQALTGTFTIPSITVTGVTLTNNNTLTVATALSGSGGLTQGSGSTLSLGGTYAITSFDAATNTNLVTYTGASPAIRATNYSSLTIAGSGTATVGGATVVNATMTVSSATTNNSTLTATTALSGGSTLTNGGTGILNIGGTSGINALTATAVGNIVNYTGAAQTVKATTYRTLGLSGSGAKDMTGVTTIQTDFNMSGTASATATAALTIGVGVATGNVTLGSGTTFIAGAFTHNVTGNWVNNGSIFTNTGSTINFNLAGAQSVGGSSSTTFNNLTLATSGNKTFGIQTIVGGTLTISGTAKADLGSITTHTANALTLGAAAQTSGTWGSTSSAATNKNDTYFLAPNTGIVTVATSPCTAGTWIGTTSTDWNDPSNWCGGVPTSSTNVVINSGGFQPVIGAAGGLANNITINGGATLTITGSNSLTVSGNWTNSGTFTANTSTVIFNGAGKTITGATTFYNVTLNGSATVTTLAAVTMNGNLTIGDGTTFTVGAFALTVTGTTTVGGGTSGALTISSATGAKTFTGLVTVSAGATWTNTAANSPVTFRGGITNNGTFNSGTGVHTFDTNAQALTGTFSIPNVSVTGVTLTNNNTLTVATALSGTGGLTQASNATLNIGAASAITTLTATAAGNTVNYTGGAQAVHTGNYQNLNFSGSAAKTLAVGTTSIGNLTLSSTATTSTVVGLAITGNLSIGNGTTFTAAGFDLTVTGTTTVGGGTSGNLTISSATGTKIFTGLVTVSAGATWNNSGNSPVTFRGGITNSSTFTAGSGVHTFDTNAQALTGTFTIPSITVTGVTLTNNNTLTVGTALSGSGGLTNSGTLNIGGTSSIATLTNTGTTAISGIGAITTALVNFTNTGTINISSSGTITGITNNANGIVNHSGSNTITSFNNATATSTLNISTTPTVPTFTTLTVSAAGNTVNYNGAGNQTVKNVTYSNLILSGSGNKTLSTITTSGNLTITGTAKALLTNATTSSAGTLTLGVSGVGNGSWGSTASTATNKNDIYFLSPNTGIINVTSGSCAAPNVSNFPNPSVPTTCPGSGAVVTVTSSSLANGTYTVTYNVSGSNTVSSTTASMVFSGGTGTFTTAVLINAGTNTVNVTSLVLVSCGTPAAVSVSASFSTEVPDLSNLSATASSDCGVTTVTVSSTTLIPGNYTVTYNVSGTNTVSSTTAAMTVVAGSPNIGTFNTATLNTPGAGNVVTITSIQNTTTTCSSTTNTSTPSFTTISLPTLGTFSIAAGTTTTGQGAVVSLSSTGLLTGSYTIIYNVTGTNAFSNTTTTIDVVNGVNTFFTTLPLNSDAANNQVNLVSIAFSASPSCTSLSATSTGVFSTVTTTVTRTISDGQWQVGGNWDNGVPNATSHAIVRHAMTSNLSDVRHLTVESSGSVNGNPNSGQIISGNFIIDGTYNGAQVTLTGVNTIIGGTGIVVISDGDSFIINGGNKVIPSTAILAVSSAGFSIASGITVTNNGAIGIGSALIGGNASTTWTNGSDALLKVSGALLTTGVLNAFAPGNTVEYIGTGQAIKNPSLNSGFATYHNLTASGTGNCTLPAATTLAVNGSLTNSATLIGTSTAIRLGGNWTNTGTYSFGVGTPTVTLLGTGDQNITTTTFSSGDFSQLVVNKNSGTVILGSNVIVKNQLTMQDGNINAGSNKITLGTSTLVTGNLTYIYSGGGAIIGKFERWINSTTAYLFPVGTSTYARPDSIKFNAIGPNGSLIVEFKSSAPGNTLATNPVVDGAVSIYNTFRDGYWSLTAANSFATSSFDQYLTGTGFTGFPITANTRYLTRASSVVPWDKNGTNTGVTGSPLRKIGRTGLTILGDYAFGDNTNCLAPVTSSITGLTTDVCVGATEVYSVTNHSGAPYFTTGYTWEITGGTIQGGTTATTCVNCTNSITVAWDALALNGSIDVYETNACTSSGAVSQMVTFTPAAPTSINGSLSVPQTTSYFTSTKTYSVTPTAGYTYNWTVSGGSIISGAGTDAIVVQWGSAGTGQICVQAVSPTGCVATSASYCTSVEIYSYVISARSGNWNGVSGNNPTWNCGCVPTFSDNAIILAGHTVTMTQSESVRNLTVISTGVLATGNAAYTLNVGNNLSVNGTINGPGIMTLSGTAGSVSLDGSGGAINNSGGFNLNANTISIPDGSTLTRTLGTTTLGASTTVINNGTFTIGGATVVNLVGSSASSTWINSDNSILNLNGALLTTGTLDASAGGNTVNYTGTSAQTIKTPSANQYANLSFNAPVSVTGTISTTNGNATVTGVGTSFLTQLGVGQVLMTTANVTIGTISAIGSNTSLTITPVASATYTAISFVVAKTGTIASPPASSSLSVSGNWVNNGTGVSGVNTGFNPNAGIIVFNGNSTISGTTTTSFNNLTITGTLNSPSINIAGNFTNNGTFNHTAGTVTFNGSSIVGGTTTPTQFINVNYTGTALTFPGTEIDVSGNLAFVSAGASFTHTASGLLKLNGSADQTVSANLASFQNVTVDKSSGTAILGSNMTVLSHLDLTKGLVNNTTSSVTMGSGAFIDRTADGSLSAAPLGSSFNLSYANGPVSLINSYSTGPELVDGSVYDIANNVTGTLTQPSVFGLRGLLSFGTDASYDAGANLLTVKSTSDTQGGSIGEIKNGSFSGTIKVERYMSAKGSVNRYVSSPVTGATFTDLVTNPGNTTFTISYNVAQYYWEPTAGNKNNGYRTVGLTSTLNSGAGYLIFPSIANSPIIWDVSGPLTIGSNQKDVTLPVGYTNTSLPTDDGWNLLGNPYPSSIKWDLIDRGDLSKIVDVVYVSSVQPNGSTVFRTWSPTFGGTLPNGYIAMGQAFWVRGKANTSITIKESSKATAANTGTFYRKSESVSELPVLEVILSRDQIEDASYLIIQPEATSAYDSRSADAFKLEGDDMGISLVSDEGYRMVYYATNNVHEKNVDLNVMANTPGNYTLNFKPKNESSNFEGLFLVDRYLGISSPLLGNPHTFEVTKSDGSKNNRFYISSKPFDEQTKEISLAAYPNPTDGLLTFEVNAKEDVTLSLYNSNGVKVGDFVAPSSHGIAACTIDLQSYPVGLYVVKAIIEGKISTLKVIKR